MFFILRSQNATAFPENDPPVLMYSLILGATHPVISVLAPQRHRSKAQMDVELFISAAFLQLTADLQHSARKKLTPPLPSPTVITLAVFSQGVVIFLPKALSG